MAAQTAERHRPSFIVDRDLLKKNDVRFENDYFEVFEGVYDGHEVAVKQLKCQRIPQIIEEFRREIEMLARIPPHENIVKFFGASIEKGDMFIVEELATLALDEFLEMEEIVLSWDHKLKISRDIAAALRHLHTQTPKILHRDLKSGNILIFANDDIDNLVVKSAKLCDFGFARVKSEINRMTGQRGTPCWTAPEVLCPGDVENMNTYDEQIDVYSLGIVLWEIATRKRPFPNMNVLEIAQKVMFNHRPEITEDIPAPFAQLIRDCWAHEAKFRPDAKQILDRLDAMKL